MNMRIDRQSTTGLPSISATLLIAFAVLVLFSSSSASAATYSVYACAGPQAQPLPNSAWLTSVDPPSQTPNFSFNGICGDLSVTATAPQSLASGVRGGWIFDAPAGTTIAGYALERSANVDFVAASGNPAVSAGLRETTGVSSVDRDCDSVTVDCAIAPGAVVRSGLALNRLALGVRCLAPAGCPGGTTTQLAASLVSGRIDLKDANTPVVTSSGGTLPGSIALAGAMTVNVTATDIGGGIARTELSIDGGAALAQSAGGNCVVPFTVRQPCPSSLVSSFVVDTRTLSDGQHFGSVRAVDAAGNVSIERPFTFTITAGGNQPGAFVPSNGSPAVERPIVRTDRSVVTARSRRFVVVEGNLTTASGQPIVGAVLEVSSLDLGVFGAKPRSIGTVSTTANGFFSTRVRPRGAQRISVLFRPTANALGTAISTTVVREKLSLSIKRSRARVRARGRLRLSGSLRGAGAAARHAPVEIDVRIGKRWRAVDVVDANSHGRYRWNYRFTRVARSTRFSFRAVVRRNASWPWPTTTSKRVKVVVTG